MSVPHRTVRSLSVLCIATILAISWLVPRTAGRANATTSLSGGITMDGTELAFEPAAQREADLDAIAATGATWVRVTAAASQYSWAGASQYNWAPLDAVAQGAARRHLNVIVAMSGLPGASSTPFAGASTANQRDAYTRFMAEAAGHFGTSIQAWEIWPAANTTKAWNPTPNASDYAALLQQVYPAIKAAAPHAVVISGAPDGVAASDMAATDFISSLYASGARDDFDALGIYGFTDPQANSLGALTLLPQVRKILDDHGQSSKDIWVTATGTAGASDATQSDYVTRSIALMAQVHDLGQVFFATLRDSATNNGLGLMRADGSRKPGYSTVTAAFSGGSPVTQASSTLGEQLGMALPSVDLLWKSDPDRVAALNRLVDAHVHWLRLDVYLDQLTWVSPSQIDWDPLDITIKEAHSRGLSIVGLLGTLPSYARPAGSSNIFGPTTDAQRGVFADFAAKAATRYAGLISTWEVWNEPNLDQYWSPTPNASDYAALLTRTSTAIKTAVPGDVILTGGTGGKGSPADIEPTQWLRDVYATGAHNSFDGVALHAYTAPQNGNIGEFLNLPTYRSIMDQGGDSTKNLWITEAGTEVGASTAATNAVAAADVSKIVDAWKATHNHGPLLFYTLMDTTAPGFGFLLADGTLRPSYGALATVAQQGA